MPRITMEFDWIDGSMHTVAELDDALDQIVNYVLADLPETWGEEAWGGYDGPKIENVRAVADPQKGD